MSQPFAVLRHDGASGPGTSRHGASEPCGALGDAQWLAFDEPLDVVSCDTPEGVLEALDTAAAWWDDGHWVVGFLTYEASPAFDNALTCYSPGSMPVAWWARCAPPTRHHGVPPLPTTGAAVPPLRWQPALDRRAYIRALETIHHHIALGDTYQVNYTFPLTAPFDGSASDLFLSLHRAQPTACHGAFLDVGRFAVCSVSPELFFGLDGRRLWARPMKGTAARGRFPQEDDAHRQQLIDSIKDRAENVMIVDMLRNDLGKVARPGSVQVRDLFAVETHPTVHQLTSTVVAQSDASLTRLMAALFPCASITGAPKVRTMELIRQLEVAPRELYTGSIGWLAPKADGHAKQARFNVAIRTAVVDRRHRQVRFGTGGGIVWDSRAEDEYEECRTKARILNAEAPSFELLETLYWHPLRGYRHHRYHLERLLASARYFGFRVDANAVARRVEAPPPSPPLSSAEPPQPLRVRWRLRRDGELEVETQPFQRRPRRPWTVTLDDRPVDAWDPFLFHKTSHRRVYDEAAQRHPEVDEVVLWNRRGELTEGLRSNLVLRLEGRWWTPRRECGLLGGVMRQRLLERGHLEEATLPVETLERAESVLLINSLRGIWPAKRLEDLARNTESGIQDKRDSQKTDPSVIIR